MAFGVTEKGRCGTCKYWRKDDAVGCDLHRRLAIRRGPGDGQDCAGWEDIGEMRRLVNGNASDGKGTEAVIKKGKETKP